MEKRKQSIWILEERRKLSGRWSRWRPRFDYSWDTRAVALSELYGDTPDFEQRAVRYCRTDEPPVLPRKESR